MRLERIKHSALSTQHSARIDPRSGMDFEFNLALTFRDLTALQYHCGGKCPAFTAAVKTFFEGQDAEPQTPNPEPPILITGPGGGYLRAWPAEEAVATDVTDATDSAALHPCPSVQSVVQPRSLRSQISNLTSDLIGGSADAAIAEQCAV